MFTLRLSARKAVVLLTAVAWFAADVPVQAGDESQQSVARQLQTLTRSVEELSRQVKALQRELDQLENRSQGAAETPKSESVPAPAAAAATTPTAQARQAPPAMEQEKPSVQQASPARSTAPVAMQAEHGENRTGPPTAAEAWASIKEGMNESQVVVLLGEPTRKFQIGGQTVWYYLYRDNGAGSIFFYDSGRVASLQKPPFARWHW